ncbi:hypothetical protein HDU77_002844 [Chytriomyces hyalinus]|nr:hypothetical protein HDU77_002844 [Chytriomyces hyalinus]
MTKWSLGALVGKGGSAQVRIVTSKDAGIPTTRKYCAKIIHLHALQKYERNAALRECKLLRSIPPHQHILRMFDCFRLDGRLYIITEYCEGGDLHQYLRALRATRAGLTDLEVWHYFNQVVSAISHLHALNILHRDIKSKNIFLDKDKKLVKLGDFGISKQLSSKSDLTSTAVGTPNSMSPELCSGRQYSFSSDLWSMGCLLFELCTSRYPFEASRLSELLRQICSDEPEWVQLRGRSFELNETTKGLLQKSIDKRITLVQLCEKQEVAHGTSSGKMQRSLPVASISDPVTPAPYLQGQREHLPKLKKIAANLSNNDMSKPTKNTGAVIYSKNIESKSVGVKSAAYFISLDQEPNVNEPEIAPDIGLSMKRLDAKSKFHLAPASEFGIAKESIAFPLNDDAHGAYRLSDQISGRYKRNLHPETGFRRARKDDSISDTQSPSRCKNSFHELEMRMQEMEITIGARVIRGIFELFHSNGNVEAEGAVHVDARLSGVGYVVMASTMGDEKVIAAEVGRSEGRVPTDDERRRNQAIVDMIKNSRENGNDTPFWRK